MSKFGDDVLRGLTATPKFLQSKYFYDAEGDQLFQQIMQSPEYYLTACELEIFSQQTETLAQTFLERYDDFDVVELGAGDASKSIYLLQYLSQNSLRFTYYPVDISKNVIRFLEKEIPKSIPGLELHGLNGEYVEMIAAANKISKKRKVVLFLGSNIGNFTPAEASHFLASLQECLLPGDLLLTGFDLKKNPKQILAAYNDAAGITKQFNLNLLKRINKELGGDFDISRFDHYPIYDPLTGACKSYLVSLQQQCVILYGGTATIQFSKDEVIQTELSQKYSVEEINALAERTGFTPVAHFFDSRKWFVDAVWEKAGQ
ncbi:MAG: L-histidine N(alpha)-methyltransferase [Chitinophagaceae bacterium]